MKRKGFTLVELLAVIAILALLVIIALPNIVTMFNSAKKNSFITEVKNIYGIAEQTWMKDNMFNAQPKIYAKVNNTQCSSELSMTGGDNIEYVIKTDSQGNIISYYATNGSYLWKYDGPGLKKTDINDVIEVTSLGSKKLKITCTNAKLSSTPPASTSDYLMKSNGTISNEYPDKKFLRTSIKKEDIEKITITNSLDGHSPNGTDCWDVSQGSTGAVLIWATDNDNNGLYELTIGANGDVFPINCHFLFSYMSNLKSIEGLEYFDTSEVKDMSNMFFQSYSIEELDLSNFNTEKVTNMLSMFSNCSSLKSLNVSSFNTENVTDMANMFNDCSSLTSLDISNFNTKKVTAMYSMFANCSNLTSLDLSNFNTEKVTSMSSMFYGCNNLTSLNVSNFNTEKVTTMYAMFYGCSNLTSLDLSNFNTEKVTSMSSMFYGCNNLASLNVSSFNTEKVTTMYSMFYECSSLISLDLSSFYTPVVVDMTAMFYNCSSLETLDIRNFTTPSVTKMGARVAPNSLGKDYGTFDSCTSLRTIYVYNDFDISKLSQYYGNIFYNTPNLVGGAGTDCGKFTGHRTQYLGYRTYLKVDEGPDHYGCFTRPTD